MDNFRRKGIIFAVLVILICIGIVFYTIFHDDSGILVPQLVGMSLPEASDALAEIGLSAKVEKVESSEAENIVVTQDIKPGIKVKQGKSLTLQVSRGGKKAKIPDVRLLKAEEAVQRLGQEGFKVTQTVRVEDSERDPGTVLAQNPYGGQSVDLDCGVELLVCAGGVSSEGMVYVPDIRGKTEEEAVAILEKNGLAAGEKSIVASTAKEGSVVRTKPGIGTRVESGVAVDLMLADGQTSAKQSVAEAKGNEKKEQTVKAVKTTEKPTAAKTGETKSKTAPNKQEEQQKKETKTAIKTETQKDMKEKSAKAAKTETKATVKTETKPAETAKPKETETKPAVKETAAETKSDFPEKSTRVRYVVPPLTKPMNLKITLHDAEGSHVLKDATVQGNEVISVPVRYKGKASLAILLGGETIWEENYK